MHNEKAHKHAQMVHLFSSQYVQGLRSQLILQGSVIHLFAEQLSYVEYYNKNFKLCTFLYISENFMEKFGLGQKI